MAGSRQSGQGFKRKNPDHLKGGSSVLPQRFGTLCPRAPHAHKMDSAESITP